MQKSRGYHSAMTANISAHLLTGFFVLGAINEVNELRPNGKDTNCAAKTRNNFQKKKNASLGSPGVFKTKTIP